jgi:hypothetical protein
MVAMKSAQNTGHPVLDSLVNIVSADPGIFYTYHEYGTQKIRELHDLLLELAQKEPGGLCCGQPGTQWPGSAPPSLS